MAKKETTRKEFLDEIVGEFKIRVGWSVEYQRYYVGITDANGSSFTSVKAADPKTLELEENQNVLRSILRAVRTVAEEKIAERAARDW